ncbi:TPA: alpha-1,2-fucosyltransferase [Campylobacter lari]|nr:alpha-1,2-fucosyltransferase [Campylobacter lari]
MNNTVIIKVDGGIASQIFFYARGQLFAKKGYKVKYDITWFDINGVNVYNTNNGYSQSFNAYWDLPKIFPDLKIDIATKDEIHTFKKKYRVNDERALEFKPPMYIDGYNFNKVGNIKNVPIFFKLKKYFNPIDLSSNKEFATLANEIENSPSCGIHIRRGDLSQEHIVYGKPTSIEYFLKTINLANKLKPNLKLFLFSDDKQWVQDNLIPHIKQNYTLCDISTPENGYLDLYLLSKCKIIIGSHGGMGLMAKLLADSNSIFITPKNIPQYKSIDNIIMINWQAEEDTQTTKPSKIKFRYKLMLKLYYILRQKLLAKFIIN